ARRSLDARPHMSTDVSTSPDVRLVGVTKRFEDVVAVDDLSLDMESGSFFALLGPSGCGKTPTLRMIGGFEQPTEGQMYLGEREGIQHDVGVTFIHVAHDQEEAMTMADRIAVMNRGRIEQLGTPTELYETPATAYVAGFLGVSNLISGTISGSDTVRLSRGPEVHVPAAALA